LEGQSGSIMLPRSPHAQPVKISELMHRSINGQIERLMNGQELHRLRAAAPAPKLSYPSAFDAHRSRHLRCVQYFSVRLPARMLY
jgi:hypothetical protein